jgi:hypothetical protein
MPSPAGECQLARAITDAEHEKSKQAHPFARHNPTSEMPRRSIDYGMK